jgi:uncharacterized protein (DUF1810 family)
MSRIERFRSAQDSSRSGFETALSEIQNDRKTGHWIWYVFPQLAGLGTSALSREFGIDGEAEAVEFLRDPELRSRLLTITTAVAAQLRAGQPLRALMGSEIDAQKLVSSLTLFGHLGRTLHEVERLEEYRLLADAADEILGRAASEGFGSCAYTLRQLQHTR